MDASGYPVGHVSSSAAKLNDQRLGLLAATATPAKKLSEGATMTSTPWSLIVLSTPSVAAHLLQVLRFLSVSETLMDVDCALRRPFWLGQKTRKLLTPRQKAGYVHTVIEFLPRFCLVKRNDIFNGLHDALFKSAEIVSAASANLTSHYIVHEITDVHPAFNEVLLRRYYVHRVYDIGALVAEEMYSVRVVFCVCTY
jgi:hypothetical protein